MNNVTDQLRKMAENGASTKEVLPVMAAVVADTFDGVQQLEETMKTRDDEQKKFNSNARSDIDANKKDIARYNRIFWIILAAIAGTLTTAALTGLLG